MTISPQTYGISSRDYLRRAKDLLQAGSKENLFYAAFELRCGIEARLQEYLEVQKGVSKKKKRGWKIANLAKHLENKFRLGDKIIEIQFFEPATKKLIVRLLYTPVSLSLQKKAKKLGDFLHAMKCFRKPNDDWWKSIRKLLDNVSDELEVSVTGSLLGPPLWNPRTGEAIIHSEIPIGEDPNEFMDKIGRAGSELMAHVRYLDSLSKMSR